MDIEDYDKYVLDVERTAFSNIPFAIYVILISMFIIKGFIFLDSLASDDTKVLGLIVFLFSVVKLFGWVGSPNLEYKPRSRE